MATLGNAIVFATATPRIVWFSDRSRRLYWRAIGIRLVVGIIAASAFAPALGGSQTPNSGRGLGKERVDVDHNGNNAQDGITETWFSDALPAGAILRIGQQNWRTDHPIEALAFSPDSKTVATSALDGLVRFWDVETGRLTRILWTEPGARCAIAFSHNGQEVATFGRSLRVHDLRSNTVRVILPKRLGVAHSSELAKDSYLAFSSDNKTIVGATGDEILRIDFATGKVQERSTTTNAYRALALSSDGELLAVANCKDMRAGVWNGRRGSEVDLPDKIRDHATMAFSNDATLLAVPLQNRVKIWSTDKRPFAKTLEIPGVDGGVIAFSPSGDTLAASVGPEKDEPYIIFVEVRTGKSTRKLLFGRNSPGPSAFSPDGKFFASVLNGAAIVVWELATGRRMADPVGITGRVNSAGISSTGSVVAVATASLAVQLWDIKSASLLRSLQLPNAEGVNKLAFSPSCHLAAAIGSGTATVFELRGGKASYRSKTDAPASVAFSKDESTVFFGNRDGAIEAVDLTSSSRRFRSIPQRACACDLFTSPDGRSVVSLGYDDTIHHWDATTGREQSQIALKTGRWDTIAIAPDTSLAVHHASDGLMHLMRLPSQQEIRHWPATGYRRPVFFSGGKRIALARARILQIWDADTGVPMFALTHHSAISELVAPWAGELILSLSRVDGVVTIWDLRRVKADASSRRLNPAAADYLWGGLSDPPEWAAESISMFLAYPDAAVSKVESYLRSASKAQLEVTGLLQRLSDSDYGSREVATEGIIQRGAVALGLVREVSESTSDLEVRRRSERILKAIEPAAIDHARLAKSVSELLGNLARLGRDRPQGERARQILQSKAFTRVFGS